MPQIAESKGEYKGSHLRDDAPLAEWLARRPTEAALEPDLPIIDPHHHFWHSPARGEYLLPGILSDIGTRENGGHNIVSTVFLECRAMYRKDGPRHMAALGEVEFVAGLAAMSASGGFGPCRIAEVIIGGGDLTLGAANVRELMEAEIVAAGGRLRGMRHGVATDAHDSISKYASRPVPLHQVMDPKFREGFAQLAPLGLSFESWQYHPQLPDAIDLARSFPETSIILNHVGGILGVGIYNNKRQEIFQSWKANITEMAKCPNVAVKLGGLGMVSVGYDFHEREVPPSSEDLAAAWRPYIEHCIEAFGVDRCMFESNFPPDKQSGGYNELWNAFKRITANASADEKRALYSGTAARVYKMIVP
jgi:predicted TIM-barrel fold metal-dependent hydrolase